MQHLKPRPRARGLGGRHAVAGDLCVVADVLDRTCWAEFGERLLREDLDGVRRFSRRARGRKPPRPTYSNSTLGRLQVDPEFA